MAVHRIDDPGHRLSRVQHALRRLLIRIVGEGAVGRDRGSVPALEVVAEVLGAAEPVDPEGLAAGRDAGDLVAEQRPEAGALWARAELLDAMPPWQGGGAMIDKVTFEKTSFAPPPQKKAAAPASAAG